MFYNYNFTELFHENMPFRKSPIAGLYEPGTSLIYSAHKTQATALYGQYILIQHSNKQQFKLQNTRWQQIFKLNKQEVET